MKLDEILTEDIQQLDEISLKQAIAAGIATGSMMAPVKANVASDKPPQTQHYQQQGKTSNPAVHKAAHPYKKIANAIADTYNIDPEFAEEVVALAHKYQKSTFPKAKDILALVGVESSFNPDAVSGLKSDPAVGLMQVRPGVWNIDPNDLQDVENQIKYGANILHHYYRKLKDKDAAVQAYNVGLTNYRHGEENPEYLGKYRSELGRYTKI